MSSWDFMPKPEFMPQVIRDFFYVIFISADSEGE